jgi:hypothetical protein
MPSLDELSEAIRAYKSDELSLDQFSAWFEDVSLGMFGEPPDVIEACLAIEAAFSRLRFEGIPEREFQQELANAIRPFAVQSPTASVDPIQIVYGKPPVRTGTANPWTRRKVSAVA